MKKLLVVAGPSGIGKTYLAQQLLNRYGNQVEQAQLFTTRQPRPNEVLPDRIFISEEEFLKRQQAGDFIISDVFHNNHYGYTQASITPVSGHLIVNAWPALLPQFTHLPNVYFVGLTLDSKKLNLLKKRMLARGDSEEKANQRLPIIKKDLADLKKLEKLVTGNGKLFTVEDDKTLPDQVIPWIETLLSLQPE